MLYVGGKFGTPLKILRRGPKIIWVALGIIDAEKDNFDLAVISLII